MDSKKDIGHTQGLGVAKGDLIHEILEAASQNELYAKALTHYSSKYHLSQYKILGLAPQKVREEFGNLRARLKFSKLDSISMACVNQRPILGSTENSEFLYGP